MGSSVVKVNTTLLPKITSICRWKSTASDIAEVLLTIKGCRRSLTRKNNIFYTRSFKMLTISFILQRCRPRST